MCFRLFFSLCSVRIDEAERTWMQWAVLFSCAGLRHCSKNNHWNRMHGNVETKPKRTIINKKKERFLARICICLACRLLAQKKKEKRKHEHVWNVEECPKFECTTRVRNPPSNLIHSHYTIMSELAFLVVVLRLDRRLSPPATHTHVHPDKNGQRDYISFTITNVSHLKVDNHYVQT